jgi:hypothetical protein
MSSFIFATEGHDCLQLWVGEFVGVDCLLPETGYFHPK